MPTFGFTTEDTDAARSIQNSYVASSGKPTGSGVCDSITVFLSNWGNGEPVKCLLYDSGLNLIGTTEELSTGGADGYHTFNFLGTKPSVTANSVYYIGAISSAGVLIVYSFTDESDDTGGYHVEDMTYATPEDPIGSFDTDSTDNSILAYCTYSAGTAHEVELSETLNLSENIVPSLGINVALAETLNLSEDQINSLGINVALAETLNLSEDVSTESEFYVVLSETLALSESIAMDISVYLSDTFGLSEDLTVELTEAIVKILRKRYIAGLKPARIAKVGRIGL